MATFIFENFCLSQVIKQFCWWTDSFPEQFLIIIKKVGNRKNNAHYCIIN